MNTQWKPTAIEWEKTSATVILVDVKGFFSLSENLPLDEAGKLISRLYGFWSSEIRRQKGEIVTYVYDSVVGIFKECSCEGKDPEWCATLTAFHISKGMNSIYPGMEVNVAIQSGEFLKGTWEEQGRTMHTIIGGLVNRAAAMIGGKTSGIFASNAVKEVLGPRVKSDRCSIKVPGSDQEETIYKLLSLAL